MEDIVKNLEAQVAKLASNKNRTEHENMIVALLNSAIERGKKFIESQKPAESAAPTTPAAAAAPTAPAAAPTAPAK